MPSSPIEIISGSDITGEQLGHCATLFSENYGTWGRSDDLPVKMRPFLHLYDARKQCLGNPERTVLAVCRAGDLSVGHAFATIWDTPDSLSTELLPRAALNCISQVELLGG